MANRLMQQFMYSFTKGLTSIHGSIAIASDASVTSFSAPGVASVVRTSAGLYTITLSDNYNALVSIGAQVQAAVAVDLVAQLKSADVVSAKTVAINLLTGAVATDPAAAIVLYFQILVRNSSVSL